MRTLRRINLSLAVFVVLCLLGPVRPRADVSFRVIAHPQTPFGSIERRFLTELFLKKIKLWPNGMTARPVDQEPDAEVRRRFSEDVLGRPVEAVRSYWQQQIFSGRDLPPPEVDHDEDVIRYVQKYPGAVGYVSSSADVRGVRVLGVK